MSESMRKALLLWMRQQDFLATRKTNELGHSANSIHALSHHFVGLRTARQCPSSEPQKLPTGLYSTIHLKGKALTRNYIQAPLYVYGTQKSSATTAQSCIYLLVTRCSRELHSLTEQTLPKSEQRTPCFTRLLVRDNY